MSTESTAVNEPLPVATAGEKAVSADLLLRILRLVARAHSSGQVTAVVREAGAGVRVDFAFPPSARAPYSYHIPVDNSSSELDICRVEQEFDRLDAAANEREHMFKVAMAAYDLLTPEQRATLNSKLVPVS